MDEGSEVGSVGGGGMGTPSSHSVLNTFDFSAIDDMDPSLAEGHRVVYDREVPVELRTTEEGIVSGNDRVGTLEGVRLKVLLQGEEHHGGNMRIEMTSETDMFFQYFMQMDDEVYRRLQNIQHLTVDFGEFPSVFIRMLNDCIKHPQTHIAVFLLKNEGSTARLEFIQNMEYKLVELLSLEFVRSSEEVVRQHITFRYNSMKSRLAMMQSRLHEVNNMVKMKNPSLLLQLQNTPKTSSRR